METTVLIVDDDAGIRMGTRLRLRSAGYQTLEAGDGQQGIDMAVEHRPDVVILDVRMPVMDGLTALNWLKNEEITKNTPVIVISASNVDQKMTLDSGARFFLAKLYQGPQMLETVAAAVAQPNC